MPTESSWWRHIRYGFASLCDFGLNNGRIVRLLGQPGPFYALLSVFKYILQPIGSSQWCHFWHICGADSPQYVYKISWSSLKLLSRNSIRSRRRRYFRQFFRFNFRPVVVVYVDVPVKFGGFRSNGSRNIRRADFVSNEIMNELGLSLSHKAEAPYRKQ